MPLTGPIKHERLESFYNPGEPTRFDREALETEEDAEHAGALHRKRAGKRRRFEPRVQAAEAGQTKTEGEGKCVNRGG